MSWELSEIESGVVRRPWMNITSLVKILKVDHPVAGKIGFMKLPSLDDF